MLTIDGSWIWDFWFADDGENFHVFYLNAPRDLGDDAHRHRAARIGHAVSADLTNWRISDAAPFLPGEPGSFDASATWTGSIVHGDDGLWRMFYTGSRFLHAEPAMANIETVGVAVSDDLITWRKLPGPVTAADPRWYETWGTSAWKEEAWRDPWVFRDPTGAGWHMLVTARANEGELDDRGVIGHAYSEDLVSWEIRPPLTRPGAGFAHLEVPQLEFVDGHWLLLFSSTTGSMTAAHAARFPDVGTWALVVDEPTRPYDVAAARPLTAEALYSGRVIRDRSGQWRFLGFRNEDEDGVFAGGIGDPIDLDIADDGSVNLRPRVNTSVTY